MKCPHCGHIVITARRLPDVYDDPEARRQRWAGKLLQAHRHEATYQAVLEGLSGERGEAGTVFAWEMISIWDNAGRVVTKSRGLTSFD